MQVGIAPVALFTGDAGSGVTIHSDFGIQVPGFAKR